MLLVINLLTTNPESPLAIFPKQISHWQSTKIWRVWSCLETKRKYKVNYNKIIAVSPPTLSGCFPAMALENMVQSRLPPWQAQRARWFWDWGPEMQADFANFSYQSIMSSFGAKIFSLRRKLSQLNAVSCT